MRNIFLIVSVLCSIVSQAQGVYFGGSIGYGTQQKDYRAVNNFDGRKDIYQGNLGNGVAANIATGYFFGSTIGAEICAGYFSGREINKTKADSFGAEGFSKAAAKCFYLNPFVVRSDSYTDVVFYMKVGPFLGLTNKATYQDKYDYHITLFT